MSKPATVDEYILSAPQEIQSKLKQMRLAIREAAPEAEEKLSYSMPYYGYKGRLVYFGYAKNHIGLYIVPPVVDDHKDELKKYVTSTSTVQFPLDEELPIALIKKLVKARIKINDAKN
jgi:uncharacterized protein YdhG (YjbR/CyaY superfamily)